MAGTAVTPKATKDHRTLPLVAVVMDDECLLDSTQMLLSTGGIRSAPFASTAAFFAGPPAGTYDAVVCSLYDCPSSVLLYQGLREASATVPLIVMYQTAMTKLQLSEHEGDGLTLIETPCGPDDLMDNLTDLLGRS